MVEIQQREAKDPNAALKAEAKALMTQRDALEQELAVATARLDASGAGLQGRLVDSEVLPGCTAVNKQAQHGACAFNMRKGVASQAEHRLMSCDASA